MMIVYHGSNSNFKTLRISNSLVKNESSLLNEGKGIYFSTDTTVARSYGKYLYALEIDTRCFKDYRRLAVCKKYVDRIAKEVENRYDVGISRYVDLEEVAYAMYIGKAAVSCIGNEIACSLDNDYNFYSSVNSITYNKIINFLYGKFALHRALPNYTSVYMFNYSIKNIGIIKDVNCARIVAKEVLR